MNALEPQDTTTSTGRWTGAHLDHYRGIGDVEADAAVLAVIEDQQLTAAEFVGWLVRNDVPVPPDVPEAVAHYFANTAWPEFADPALVAAGEHVFTEWGPQICVALFCASLPVGYSADRIVRVLHSTGALETRALRRVFETAQFLFDVMDEGGLGPDGKGIRAAQRVRLMHAGVRHLLIETDAETARAAAAAGTTPELLWPSAWGKPINQEDLAGTLLTFTVVVIDALEKLGVRLSADERRAYMHVWRVIGHFMGIVDEMLPVDEDDARQLWRAEQERQLYRTSEEGRHMAAALVGAFSTLVPGKRADFIGRGLVRHLSGGRACEAIGVSRLRWGGHVVFAATMRINRMFVRKQQHDPHFLNVTGRFQRDLIHGLVFHEPAKFVVPDRLREDWRLAIAAKDPGPR